MATLQSGGGASEGAEVFKIEDHGIDAIPASERRGRPRDLAFLWAGAFINYASLLTASLLTSFFGLGVVDGLVAVVAGSVSAALILGLLSNSGPATGLPQVVFTRRVFGARGAKVGAALTLFLAVGWFAVDSVIAAQAGVQLLDLFGAAALAAKAAFPLVVVIAALSVVVAVYGHRTIQVFETYGAIAFVVLCLVLFFALGHQFNFHRGPSARGADYPGAFVLGFMVCFALIASWYPFASDYSRYLPERSSRAGVTLWPVVGIAVPMVLLGLFGLLIPTIDPRLAADPNGGVLAIITKDAPLAVAIPFFAFVILGEIWANYLDVYTAGLVALTMGIRLRRWQTAAACGILGALLASYAVVFHDFHSAYEQFLLLTYLWAPAWAAVVLLAVFVLRRGSAGRALLAWAAGSLASLLFVNYPNIFPGLHAFNQPLVDQLHQADISGLVSIGVAALVYWLLMARRGEAAQ
ncbi:MAG: purine-cytosine permease family protein [Candidatus Dormibacteraceae bacterium]